jgi:hypothetical protein
MVDDCIVHVTLNPEGMLKLFVWKPRYITDPVTENTVLRPLVVILNAGPLKLFW